MFIAVDGEGITVDGHHIYTLLAASDGTYIEDYKGLPMLRCFDYLLSLAGKDQTIVSFSFYYDITMILIRDIHPAALKSLRSNGFCHIGGGPKGLTYRVEYLKRKLLKISLGKVIDSGQKRVFRTVKSVTVYDVIGFFQCSFVNALMNWGIANRKDLEDMIEMKDARDAFALRPAKEIRDYNYQECIRLVEIMNRLVEKLYVLGVTLKSFHGAGAVANAVLKKHGAEHYLPPSVHVSNLSAYFGGRIQTLQLGRFENVYSYDIRSAYPYAMSKLPRFFKTEPYLTTDGIGDFDIIKLKWNCFDRITPFPFRYADKSIQFHSSGQGYYHACEYFAALEVLGPKNIEVEEVWHIQYDSSDHPFSWIDDYYQLRAMFRAAKDEVHIAIKLALNSLYGKTAQKIGYRGKAPKYRSYMVAGAITAKCRSMLYTATAQNMDACIMFATDGIASTDQLSLSLGENLGEWEESIYDYLDVYQAGFYSYSKLHKVEIGPTYIERHSKTRSMNPTYVDWDYVKREWDKLGVKTNLVFGVRDFISIGLASSNLPGGEWVERPKKLSLYPNKGRPRPQDNGTCILKPLPGPEGLLSAPYRGHLADDDDTKNDELQVY